MSLKHPRAHGFTHRNPQNSRPHRRGGWVSWKPQDPRKIHAKFTPRNQNPRVIHAPKFTHQNPRVIHAPKFTHQNSRHDIPNPRVIHAPKLTHPNSRAVTHKFRRKQLRVVHARDPFSRSSRDKFPGQTPRLGPHPSEVLFHDSRLRFTD